MTLNELKVKEVAKVESVGGEKILRQHFLDMGLIPGTEVTLVRLAPMGDPMELSLHGYNLTLRIEDARKIEISKVTEKSQEKRIFNDISKRKKIFHPGLGEGGKFHDISSSHPLPKEEKLTFALAGNQNSGKTTLFNQLTGSNQHVGNFPGVTVDQKSGIIKGKENTLVTDLPGIYSLSPYSEEEIVSRNFILKENPRGIINIVDATNIERNLYLTLQLMELNRPMTIALNMMDEVTGNGGCININKMEEMLGVPIVPISARKNEGVKELIDHSIHVAKYQETPLILDFCDENNRGGAVHRAIHSIMYLIEDHAKKYQIPLRFASTKIIEGDELIINALHLSTNELEMIEHIIVQMEEESSLDRQAAIADMRFSYIKKVCSLCVEKPRESKEHIRSEKIDRFLTGKYTAIPFFILIMGLVFFLTFNVIGLGLQTLFEMGIDAFINWMDNLFTSWNVSDIVHSLVIEGIFQGVGSVLSFLPIIVTLFFFLSILEDTGYMARIAFVMDKLLRKIGLSGKSIVPMLIGFGCTVPGVMATRTLSSERDRKMTIFLTPFMSCSAKLPIYSFICSIFFGKWAWLVMIGLYLFGIILGVLYALLLKKTIFKGEAIPFVMELPNYRLPGLKNVFQLLWDKVKDFIKKACSVILIASIIIWFLQSFNFRLEFVSDPSNSMLSIIAGGISVIFKPLGFGDYRYTTALISGIMAKESVVSTLLVLFGNEAMISSSISIVGAISFLVFSLLYTPCIAAIASIKQELGIKYALGVASMQFIIAYLISGVVALIGFIVGVI
ncbi:MAG: ferrous iron transport protein B [Bacillales bacterium]|nr:ferrous iron transport protein B [Bacillales bacterium]